MTTEAAEWIKDSKQAAFDHMREQVAETQARFDAQHPRHYAGTDCTCAEAGTQDLRKAVTCLNYAIGRLED
jgi:phage shock protein A